ncbi:MAG: sugar phosphate isomerase/epimerase [Anaerolineae bacterium]
MRIGLDLYSIRSQPWNAFEKLAYCQRLGVQVAHFGLEDLGTTDPQELAAIKARADELGLEIEVGMGSICETSTAFNPQRGSAVDQTQAALRVAASVGSRVLKVLLGNGADRRTETPMSRHIANCVKTCKAVREQARELGIVLAVETHGDLQGREVQALIDTASDDGGPRYVGACLDSGNPVTLGEDPLVTFDYLAPVIVTSHIRDSAVWSHPRGAAYQWLALGDGNVGLETLTRRFKEECSQASYTLEILTGRPPTVLPYLEDDYWAAFPDTPAWEFARFERLVRQGLPFSGTMVAVAPGVEIPTAYQEALRAQQLYDVERSVAWAKRVLEV